MIQKIVSDGGRCGIVQTGSYGTTVLPSIGPTESPKYIISGKHGTPIISYSDMTSMSPVFNQNDPRCGETAIVFKTLTSDRFWMLSLTTPTPGSNFITIYSIETNDILSGKYSPKTKVAFNFFMRGTFYPFVNVSSGGVCIFSSYECVYFSPEDPRFVTRCVTPVINFRMNNLCSAVLIAETDSKYSVLEFSGDTITKRDVDLAGKLTFTQDLTQFACVTDGFVMYSLWGGPDVPIVASQIFVWDESAGNYVPHPGPTSTKYVGKYLRRVKISASGVVSETKDITPPMLKDPPVIYWYNYIQWPDGEWRYQYKAENYYAGSVDLTQGRSSGSGGDHHSQVYAMWLRLYYYYGGGSLSLYSPYSGKFPILNQDSEFQSLNDIIMKIKDFEGEPSGEGTDYTTIIFDPRLTVRKGDKDILGNTATAYDLKLQINGAYPLSPMISTIYHICPV